MSPPKIIAFSRTRGAPVSQAIQQRAIDRIVQCLRMLNTDMPNPTVSFDLRGTTSGQAYFLQNHLRFNGQLLNENTDEFIEQTVAHEVAHLVAHHVHGNKIRAHGVEWKNTMHALGLDASRCHSYEVTKARTVKPKVATKHVAKKVFKGFVGTSVLPPVMVAPLDITIDIRIPGALPPSPVMWAYAEKLANKRSMPLPAMLAHNQTMLVQWIELARSR